VVFEGAESGAQSAEVGRPEFLSETA